GGHALAVRLEYLVDEAEVGDPREALVVDDHVIPVGPAGGFVDADPVVPRPVPLVDDRPFDPGAGGDRPGQQLLLGLVVVAATPPDVRGANGTGGVRVLGRRGRGRGERQGEQGERGPTGGRHGSVLAGGIWGGGSGADRVTDPPRDG